MANAVPLGCIATRSTPPKCLPLYLHTPDGQRVSNITGWGLRQFHEHFGDDGITAGDIFAYTYAVLHDPEYREKYAVDLLREFPACPSTTTSLPGSAWARNSWTCTSASSPPSRSELVDKNTEPSKALLRADKARGAIVLDATTTLTGVPAEAWEYRLGSRSALEWVLDQYKERTPRDPTIREKFKNYKFADHKERVIDLLQRVCTVSVETSRIVDSLSRLTATDPG